MQIRISPPRHYEIMCGSSDLVHAYLNQIEEKVGEAVSSEALDILRISLLITQPEEIAQGLFLEYQKFDWRCGYGAVGINGDFERYHSGDDLDKIRVLSEMLQSAFVRVSQKTKAKFKCGPANEIVLQIMRTFEESCRTGMDTGMALCASQGCGKRTGCRESDLALRRGSYECESGCGSDFCV